MSIVTWDDGKAHPKPAKGTHRQQGRDRREAAPNRPSSLKRARALLDKLGSEQTRERSGGRCEVYTEYSCGHLMHCLRSATHVHHMISGRGKRGIGLSALAEHKQHVCDECHTDIHGDVGGKKLHRVGGPVPRFTDRYRRSQQRNG